MNLINRINPTNEAGKSQYPPVNPYYLFIIVLKYCFDSIRVKKIGIHYKKNM